MSVIRSLLERVHLVTYRYSSQILVTFDRINEYRISMTEINI